MEQTANLIWDADRSWWLTTDIDLNSSYIGGGEPLIEALLRSDKLETWPVASEDGRFDPDPFNPAPPDPPPTERFPPSWLPLWQRLWLEFRLGLPEIPVPLRFRRKGSCGVQTAQKSGYKRTMNMRQRTPSPTAHRLRPAPPPS